MEYRQHLIIWLVHGLNKALAVSTSPAMGENKRKQHNQKQFLLSNRWCVYCGAPSETVDHCPPRCFFRNRQWPETYEFPACKACNQEARGDEQVLAVLARHHLGSEHGGPDYNAWMKLVEGVMNNQRAYTDEWFGVRRVEQKRQLRENFALDAKEVSEFATVNIGPLTQKAIERFGIKMGKALFYRHNASLFDGWVILRHVNGLMTGTEKALAVMLQLAPEKPNITRNRQRLSDQFTYRYNHSVEHGAIHAVVAFNPQLVLSVTAFRDTLMQMLMTGLKARGEHLDTTLMHHCPLKY